jgi:hypothetical protein
MAREMNMYRENRTGKWGDGRLAHSDNINNKNSAPTALFSSKREGCGHAGEPGYGYVTVVVNM